MNICLENAVFCDQKGLQYKLDNYAIRFRQILYVQIPESVSKTNLLTKVSWPRDPCRHRFAQTPSRQEEKIM